MARQVYQLGSAYIKLLPSFDGLTKKLTSEFNKATPEVKTIGAALGEAFSKSFGGSITGTLKVAFTTALQAGMIAAAPAISEALENAADGLGDAIGDEIVPEREIKTLRDALKAAGDALGPAIKGSLGSIKKIVGAAAFVAKPFNMALKAGMKGIGSGLASTLSLATKASTTAIAASLGAVAAQTIGGGFQRALGINSASAKLQALGYEGEKFTSIMKSASDAVDGTAFTLADSVGATAGLLAAGIKEGDSLTGVLKNAGKLADISGRSFADMGSIMGKSAASGIVQMDILNQLLDAGVPITSYLAKNLGKSVAEIKKMASAGDISFDNLNDAITSIDFDSALLASKDVNLAFRNMESQLSKQGANLWTPIIDGLLPIIIDARKLIMTFGKSFNFNPIQTKLADGMAKIGKIFDRFKDVDGEFSGDKISKSLENITDKFTKFHDKIKSLKGPVIGAMIGVSGAFLSGIPFIGPMFAGITPIVGLFAGTLIQAYKSSEKLRDAISGLGTWVSELGKKLSTAFTQGKTKGTDYVGAFGDRLGEGIGKLQEVISGIVDRIAERMPEIKQAFVDVWASIKEAFSGGKELSGADLGNILVDTFKIVAGYVQTIAPIMVSLAKSVGDIIASDAFKGFFSWVSDVAKTIAEHKDLLLTLATTVGTLFVAGKLAGPILGMFAFFGKLAVPAAAASGLAGIGPAIGAMISGFVGGLATAMGAVTAALGPILLGLGSIAIILAALAAIGWLVGLPGVMDAFRSLGSLIEEIMNWIVTIVQKAIEAIMPLLIFLSDHIIKAFEVVVNGFVEILTVLISTLPAIIGAVSGLLVSFSIATVALLKGLSEYGVSAGVGAFAAAAGIAALLLALGAGSAVAGVGNAIGGFFSAVTGQKNPLDQVIEAVERLASASSLITNMPSNWNAIAVQALDFGVMIPRNIAAGIERSANEMNSALDTQLDSMLRNSQAFLDKNPLKISTIIDQPKLSSDAIAGSGRGGSMNSTTTNNNIDIRTSNPNVANTLLRSFR